MPHRIPPKQIIAAAFSRGADTYDDHACLQRPLAAGLARALHGRQIPAGPWLDAGCGTGLLADLLDRRTDSPAMGMDLAFACLRAAKDRGVFDICVQADMESMPFADGSLGAIVSSAALQWLSEPRAFLAEARRTLVHRGMLAIGVFLEGSFLELSSVRRSHGIVDPVVLPPEESLRGSIEGAGFSIETFERLDRTIYYRTARDFFRALHATGSTAAAQRPPHVLSLAREYSRRFRTPDGVPVTCRSAVAVATRI